MQDRKRAANPTTTIDVNFAHYVQQRKGELAAHVQGNVPDYSFGMDLELRRRLASVGFVRSLTKLMVSLTVPINRQQYLMNGVVTNSRQFPEIYELAVDSARRLGIGTPQVFIYPHGQRNAFTWATDDVVPIIVITTGLVEALDLDEMKFVIGHECGHIHNLHGVYNVAVEMTVNPLAQLLLAQMAAVGLSSGSVGLVSGLVRSGLQIFMLQWSRCAEITCDRAGMICCGDLAVAQRALMKLVVGGSERLQGFNIDEYLKQLEQVRTTPARFLELGYTHPLIPKRISALRAFAESEMFASWRPDIQTSRQNRSKQEVDWLCAQIVSVTKGEGDERT